MAGKDTLARELINYTTLSDTDVRFILEKDFRRLAHSDPNPVHQFLFWLAFDIGENISALLRLKREDCYREQNPTTNEPEYRINLRQEIPEGIECTCRTARR